MTLFHFGNCCALAYAPYFLTYKYSGLSEYGVFWKCVQASAMYLLTQLCKMLFLATFFPTTDATLGGGLDVMGEIFKSTVDFADLVGLHFIMTQIAGKGELKILVAGTGWATAELVMTRFLPLWVGARGMEFDWKYIQMSLDSNVSLVHHIATATLIWLWSRNDLKKSVFPVVGTLLMFSCYKPLFVELIAGTTHLGSWSVLAFRSLTTIIMGLTTLQLYVGFTQGMNSF